MLSLLFRLPGVARSVVGVWLGPCLPGNSLRRLSPVPRPGSLWCLGWPGPSLSSATSVACSGLLELARPSMKEQLSALLAWGLCKFLFYSCGIVGPGSLTEESQPVYTVRQSAAMPGSKYPSAAPVAPGPGLAPGPGFFDPAALGAPAWRQVCCGFTCQPAQLALSAASPLFASLSLPGWGMGGPPCRPCPLRTWR